MKAAASSSTAVEAGEGLNQRSAQFILLPPRGSDMGEREEEEGESIRAPEKELEREEKETDGTKEGEREWKSLSFTALLSL
jgi:hypothetical protein